MKDFTYIGLFLAQESRDKLAKWLYFNGYSPETTLMQRNSGWYLDHCTLFHKNQMLTDTASKNTISILLDTIGKEHTITITHLGNNDKALAFRVTSDVTDLYCFNDTPHITVCTFEGGKPVDSNNITKWKEIDPIIVNTILETR